MRIGVFLIGAPCTQDRRSAGSKSDDGAPEFPSAEYVRRYATAAEAVGFSCIWIPDHGVMPTVYSSRYPYQAEDEADGFARYPFDATPFPEPLATLAFLAGITERIRLGTAVLVVPRRDPVLVAQQVATVDRLSNGRVDLGVGIGWWKEEFAANQAAWEGRGSRLDEAIEAMRTLWRDDVATFHGPSVSFDSVRCEPKPVLRHVPIIVGGHSDAAARRAGRLGDGFFPLGVGASGWAPLLGRMRRAAEEAGRDPAAMTVLSTASPDVEHIEQLAEMGVSDVFLRTPHGPPDEAVRFMETTGAMLVARFKDG